MNEELERVVVEHREGEDKPWHINLEGVGVLGTGRALLNHPTRNFSTQEEAEEVAEKIRELIKADLVQVQDEISHQQLETDYDAAIQEDALRETRPDQPSSNDTLGSPSLVSGASVTNTVDDPPAAPDADIVEDEDARALKERMESDDVDPLLADDFEDSEIIVGDYPEEVEPEEPIVLTPVDPESQPEGPLAAVDDIPPEHTGAPGDVDVLVEPREVDREAALEDLPEGEQESEIRSNNLM